MSQIMTHSHKMFDPLRPDPKLIDITDIAHALSMLCRANGHFRSFYSVGQHCINCALEAKARGYSKRVQLGCLLHDASEAYLADVTRPVKQELPRYQQIEEPLQETIWQTFMGTAPDAEEQKLIFLIDDDVLLNEFPALMGAKISETVPQLQAVPQFAFTGFEECQQAFLQLFTQLTE